MSKHNGNSPEQQWNDIAYILGYTFGDENVINDTRVLRITYDTKDTNRQHLFYILSGIIGSDFIEGSTAYTNCDSQEIWIPGQHDEAQIALTISKDQNADILLKKLLSTFGTRRQTADGKKVELHPTGDVFYEDLARMTGVDWKIELGGEYSTPVIKPKLSYQPGDSQRTEQELALAEAAIPTAHVKADGVAIEIRPTTMARNWLEEQRHIEAEKAIGPQSAMPTDMIDASNQAVRDHVSGNSYSEGARKRVSETFKER